MLEKKNIKRKFWFYCYIQKLSRKKYFRIYGKKSSLFLCGGGIDVTHIDYSIWISNLSRSQGIFDIRYKIRHLRFLSYFSISAGGLENIALKYGRKRIYIAHFLFFIIFQFYSWRNILLAAYFLNFKNACLQ